ncbi:hypothetical protein IQ247_24215 [Plectonema cf. radiosum LEGE 06105]|uniref:Uncharacterized protein n=1 Tax=Plectonema cf. radiosum LEGE 06105 TaxID=945769 RepID=A0A8J7F5Z4_9CYAN|nr:hypothetical protein [Plectonema radiosum]MBE9215732.1 hypothetical protein [Plectonema cf. radiosum LEGE 06105]
MFAQSNSIGCEAKLDQPFVIKSTDTAKLTAMDIIGAEVEQIGNNQQQTLSTSSPYKSSTTKDVANYWQIRVKNSDLPINANDVKYTLRPNTFDQNSPFKRNKFEPKPFGTIETIENCPDQTTVISGGVTLEFRELSSLVPGKFRGEIEICVPINRNQCG